MSIAYTRTSGLQLSSDGCDTMLYHILTHVAHRHPDLPAITVPGSETLSYSDLLVLTDTIAEKLHGLDPGDLLAVQCRNSCAYVALIFATAKLRLSYVPIMSNFTSTQVDEVARMEPRLYVHDIECDIPSPMARAGYRIGKSNCRTGCRHSKPSSAYSIDASS